MAEDLQDVENTTLPAVRGQEMPARTQETQQEQPDLHPVRVEQTAETVNTVLPAVRGNEMPERAQEARTTEDKENSVADSFVKFTQSNSQDNGRALFNSLQDLMTDYQMQGLSAREIQEKMSVVLSSAYDMGVEQGLNPDMLKANITQFSEQFNKLSAEANQEGMTVANNVAQMDAPTVSRPRFQDDIDIEDAEIIEEIPAEPVVENNGNEAADAPAQTDENEGHEGTDAPEQGHENQGSFAFVEDEPEMTHTATHTGDLKQQLLNTAFKNRYMLVEAENEEPQRMCPFAQLKVRTIEDNSDDEKNPYVKMELESGNRIYNRPNQVDVHYDTFVTQDENGNTVKKPQISFEDCMAAVRVGMEKGWTSATLSGPDAYKEQMYLAMCAMGMKVVGYEPSEELKKEGERLAKLHAVDRDHAASVDQRFDDLEAARKEAGIKEPEQIGKEFIDDMKKRGLGYTPPVQNNENSGNESEGNDEAGTPAAPTNENEGNDDAAGTPAAPTNGNEGNDEAGTPAAPTNGNEGNDDAAGTPAAPVVENEGQEAVQQPQQLQLPEHIEQQQPQQLQLPEHVEQQQPQQLQLPEHVEQQQPQQLQLPEHVEQQQPQQLQLPAHEEQQQSQTALVPVTPEIQNKMEAVALTSTTALAKTDPAKAQQAAAQIAATPGIANQLQLAGRTANEAKGNDVKVAQQQHQQETALVLAARNNNHTK